MVLPLAFLLLLTQLSPVIFDPQKALRSAGGDAGVGCDGVNGLVGPQRDGGHRGKTSLTLRVVESPIEGAFH